MSARNLFPLIAVDVGNQRMKFGRFEAADWGRGLPEPAATLAVAGEAAEFEALGEWLEGQDALPDAARGRVLHSPVFSWWVGSVNRPASGRLLDWLRARRPEERVTLLAAGDLPLPVALERPDMVGIDRLLDAVGANRLRAAGRPAVVVDVGTAITVDLLSAGGAFLGGAILPGIAMSARALHAFTDLLPLVEIAELAAPPPVLGRATIPAIRSGLFWGAVGAVRELVARLSEQSGGEAEVFLTGGAGPAVAALLGPSARHVPHLTLAGIALAAAGSGQWPSASGRG
jgi:type III pantothenate kinase